METKWFVILVISIFALMALTDILGKKDNNETLDKCIALSNILELDPNEEKVEFIKDCYKGIK